MNLVGRAARRIEEQSNKRRRGRSRIGTSGWHYLHWRGAFYPGDVAPSDMLRCYARTFDSVEINSSFYRLPSAEALSAWVRDTPPKFVFACKASRYITHMKKLKDPESSLPTFLKRIEILDGKLGPILFQLPPRWRPDAERLEAFVRALPIRQRVAFELRDQRWHRPDILRLLERHNCASCLYELGDRSSPSVVTADFVYIRLHGPDAPYRGCYDEAHLAEWAARIAEWQADGLDVYCYFDNDERAFAPRNAQGLIRRIGELQARAVADSPHRSGRT